MPWLLCLAALEVMGSGCDGARADTPDPLQGIVEFEDVHSGFEVGGRLASLEVQQGDSVHKGQVLARLDDTLERLARDARQADLDAAKAQLALLQAGARHEDIRAAQARVAAAHARQKLLRQNLERQERLASTGAAPTAQTDDLSAQVAGAQADQRALQEQLQSLRHGARPQQIDAARARVTEAQAGVALETEKLAQYVLEAPESGMVLDVPPEQGEVVGPGATIVTLADVDHPYVDVFVPQAQVRGLHLREPARVRVDSLGSTLHGYVEHIAERTEFTPRFIFSDRERPNLVIRVRIRVNDPHHRLHAGIPAFVTVAHGGP